MRRAFSACDSFVRRSQGRCPKLEMNRVYNAKHLYPLSQSLFGNEGTSSGTKEACMQFLDASGSDSSSLSDLVIIYNVEITIDPKIETEWLEWMQQVHVPDVFRTGCFVSCQIYKVLDAEGVEPIYLLQ